MIILNLIERIMDIVTIIISNGKGVFSGCGFGSLINGYSLIWRSWRCIGYNQDVIYVKWIGRSY
jgi:hypothetical protein